MTDDDSGLLTALAHAMSARRTVPEAVVMAGKAAFAWRGIRAEIARLAHDSSTVDQEQVLSRADQAVVRSLTFESAGLTIEVELDADDVRGQLVPHQAAEVRLQPRDREPMTAKADLLGYFEFTGVPTSSFRLICVLSGERMITTVWVSV